MVTLTESRELLLILALIGGCSGAFLLLNKPLDASTSLSVNTAQIVANPVVHIDVPAHNIFAP